MEGQGEEEALRGAPPPGPFSFSPPEAILWACRPGAAPPGDERIQEPHGASRPTPIPVAAIILPLLYPLRIPLTAPRAARPEADYFRELDPEDSPYRRRRRARAKISPPADRTTPAEGRHYILTVVISPQEFRGHGQMATGRSPINYVSRRMQLHESLAIPLVARRGRQTSFP